MRVEDPEVFAVTHAKIVELVRDGVVDGVRVDHVDGLADPAGYLQRLREVGIEHVWVEKILEPGEALPPWPVEGTTGYDFLVDVDALFVDPDGRTALDATVAGRRPFHERRRRGEGGAGAHHVPARGAAAAATGRRSTISRPASPRSRCTAPTSSR